MNLIIRAQSTPWHGSVAIFIGDKETRTRVHGITMVAMEEGLAPDPAFNIPVEAAQLLMDDLWMAGIRPTEGSGSAGSLAATQRHLEDMRTIAFEKLKIPERKHAKTGSAT